MRIGQWVRRQSKRNLLVYSIGAVVGIAQVSILMEALIRARLDDEMFRAPTRIYARPLVLYSGLEIERDRIDGHLRRLGYERSRRYRVGVGEYRLDSRTWTIGVRAFRQSDRLDPGGVATIRVGYGGRVRSISDASGASLRYLSLEPELLRSTFGTSNEDRVPVPLTDLPDHLVAAVLAIEDRRFFQHGGLDLKRVVGATAANVRALRVVQGGSTITQQLAKNLFLSPRRTPLRKVREAAMAVMLERRHSKEEILEAYLNEVYLGQDGGLAIHGVGRAAEFYFQKDVSQLELSEAAVLAGIIRGPSLYSPIRNPESAERRRNVVLEVMKTREVIDEDTFAAARDSKLGIAARRERTRSGRYFVDFVSNHVSEELGSDAVAGVTVFTTLDLELQRIAESAVDAGLARLERENPGLVRDESPLQAALVAIDPHTGEVLAMVGGRDYGASQFNRAVRARRQPGSSFKPIVALAALAQRDEKLTLATLLPDEPLSVSTPAGVWQPANYDGRFRGSVTLRDALERSLNVPFARLGLEVGPERIVATGQALGVQSELHAVPSIALGASEVTPLEMARAYGVLAANGLRADIQTTLGVLDSRGSLVSRMEPQGERVFDPSVSYLVTSALVGAVERGTGRGLRRFGFRGSVAAKSGTTNDFRDAWFIGYTPSLAVAVWVGFDDGRSIGVSGARAALPIFARFLKEAAGPDGQGEFDMPAGVEVVEVDPETGLRAGWGCRGRPEVFVRGTAPARSCSPSWASSRTARQWSRARDALERAWRDQRRRSSRGRN